MFASLKTREYKKNSFFSVLVLQKDLYYLSLHLRFASRFSSFQLADLFSYEIPRSLHSTSSSTLVYNFHGIRYQERIVLFSLKDDFFGKDHLPKSLVEIFPNAWWLEREVSELHSVFFEGKKDVRNLMLQYGDTSHPFRKSYPSIGTREMFYDGPNDIIVQSLVTTQI